MKGRKDLRDLTTVPQTAGEAKAQAEPEKPAAETASTPETADAKSATEPKSAPAPEPASVPRARRRAQPPREPFVPFKFRVGPFLLVLLMAVGLLLLPRLIVDTVSDFVGLPVYGSDLASTVASHTVMLALALGVIWFFVRGGRSWRSFGLDWPPGRSYVATAFIIGILFGAAMAVVDYAPDIARHVQPHGFESMSPNPAGWLLFQGLYVGPSEEIPFRALLVGYLAVAMPGRVRFGRFEMNGAGIVVAAIFAIGFGLYALVAKPFVVAIGEALYIFLGSAALAYWLERSKSIVAPIVGHNMALLTWQALVFAMVYAWR